MEITKYRALICYWSFPLLYSLHPNGEDAVRQLFKVMQVMQLILTKCVELAFK